MEGLFKSLLIVLIAAVVAFGFSTAGFAVEHKAPMGNQQKSTIPGKTVEHKELGKMETATGRVTSVDPQGKAITISEKIGGNETMDVGTIVSKDTVVKINGKEASLGNIKVGDTVTIRYLKSDDLYAKEIVEG